MALITAAEARAAGIASLGGSSDQDTLLDTLIDRADHALATWLGYPDQHSGSDGPTLESVTYTLYLDGPDADAPDRLTLPVRAVSSITTIHSDPQRDYGSDTLIASTDYDLDGTEGVLYLRPDASSSWDTARRAIKVVCVAGWADTEAPPAVKQAAALLVRHWFDLGKERMSMSSVSQGDVSTSYRRETIPAVVAQLVEPYRVGGFLG